MDAYLSANYIDSQSQDYVDGRTEGHIASQDHLEPERRVLAPLERQTASRCEEHVQRRPLALQRWLHP